MQKSYKNCQSCDMPLLKDPMGGGTNADGSKSGMYCSYCYKDGSFLGTCTTAKEMQEFCKKMLKDMGYNGLAAWFMTMRIPHLERWKKN